MADSIPGSRPGVVKKYENCTTDIRSYFTYLPSLVQDFDLEVVLGFIFIRVEKAHNAMLYRGAIKLHKAEAQVACNLVGEHHMTRKEFRRLFRNVFGKDLKRSLRDLFGEAETIHDKVVHGKDASEADKRRAIVRVLEYTEGMNEFVHEISGFKPFTSDPRGFKGRGGPWTSLQLGG